MLKGSSVSQPQNSQVSWVSCSHCNDLNQRLSYCPYFVHQLSTGQGHVNMAYQRPESTLIQGEEITLTFLGVLRQMLWALPPNLDCFFKQLIAHLSSF